MRTTRVLVLWVGCAAACDRGVGEVREARPHSWHHAGPRDGLLSLGPSDGPHETWRATREGPAVHWRLPNAGGTIALPTDAGVSVRGEGSHVRLTALDGRAWIFGPVLAFDSRGEAVAVRFEPSKGEVHIVAEAAGNAGPVWVDPVLRTAPFMASFAADSVAGVGDLDGDGFDELAAGAVGGTTTIPGQVLVWPGAAAGPGPASTVDPTPPAAGWQYGRSVAGDGDLDADGYADLVVGGDHRAWVHYGSATGVGRRTVRLDDPEGRTGEFGFSVGIAPDLNGDGVDDLLVGDPGYDGNRGRVLVHHGSRGADVGSTADVQLEGQTASEWFGVAVAGAGDIDGDALGDLVVGAHAWSGITGRAYIFLGSASGLPGTPDTTLSGVNGLDNFGRAVDAAGDVNQDGYADLVIGAFNGASAYGQASVFHGSPTGLATVAATVVAGPAWGAKFGNTVAGLGDVDGDGYPDVGMGGHGTVTQAGGHHGGPAGVETAAVPALSGGVTFGKFLDGAGDLDGDGFADLVVADPGAGTVAVHFGGPDLDGDGWVMAEDCDDADTGVRGGVSVWDDRDADGFGDRATEAVACVPATGQVLRSGDCDDARDDVHPDAMEVPGDRLDGNCDGWEQCFVDADGDGVLSDRAETVGVETVSLGVDCSAHGYLGMDAPWGDCDDAAPDIHPGAAEVCNGRDDDCDGAADVPMPEDAPFWWPDDDGDGAGRGVTVQACAAPEGYVPVSDVQDCDDANPSVYPGATDLPDDGIDADCDGLEETQAAAEGPTSDAEEKTGDGPNREDGKAGCQTVALRVGSWWWGALGLWGLGRRRVRLR
ncbi:MAG TPA: hypothetical protein DFR83_23025 [Deltaproteobacteria bacterium]|nr:hypothetical protein [Deltaproteobacteria bacterium]